MVKWEYKIYVPALMSEKIEESLNKLGADGWELVCMFPDKGFSILKRQGSGWHGRMLEDSKICELRDSAGNKLTERAKNVLQRLNVRTLGELCCLDGERLKHTANCGKGTLFQLRDVAEYCGTGILD